MENKRLILSARVLEFVIYSFIGWLYEEICELVLFGKFSDRGFLTLPVCVIYGFFTIIILKLFNKKSSKPVNVFFISLILVTAMEYISGLVIECVLGKPLWDYSMWIYNFQGRVSLISSLIFAFACTTLVFVVHPALYDFFTKRIKGKITHILSVVFVIMLLIDFGYNIIISFC